MSKTIYAIITGLVVGFILCQLLVANPPDGANRYRYFGPDQRQGR